eukprot:COSAG05_NODE_86_length_20511_cov_71.945277_11_plen_201_part_00
MADSPSRRTRVRPPCPGVAGAGTMDDRRQPGGMSGLLSAQVTMKQMAARTLACNPSWELVQNASLDTASECCRELIRLNLLEVTVRSKGALVRDKKSNMVGVVTKLDGKTDKIEVESSFGEKTTKTWVGPSSLELRSSWIVKSTPLQYLKQFRQFLLARVAGLDQGKKSPPWIGSGVSSAQIAQRSTPIATTMSTPSREM